MVRFRQSGFTLIEITIVLAISGLLLTIVLNGFSVARGQAQFSAAVEGLKETVSAQRAVALANINTNGPTGLATAPVSMGRLVKFDDPSGDLVFYDLNTANTANPSASDQVTAVPSGTSTPKWGLHFTPRNGFPNCVAFTHSLVDNSLQTVSLINCGASPFYTYGQFAKGTGVSEFEFQDVLNHTAYIQVEQDNGGITRRYQ